MWTMLRGSTLGSSAVRRRCELPVWREPNASSELSRWQSNWISPTRPGVCSDSARIVPSGIE